MYNVIKTNPYKLDDIPGVGFKMADEIPQRSESLRILIRT